MARSLNNSLRSPAPSPMPLPACLVLSSCLPIVCLLFPEQPLKPCWELSQMPPRCLPQCILLGVLCLCNGNRWLATFSFAWRSAPVMGAGCALATPGTGSHGSSLRKTPGSSSGPSGASSSCMVILSLLMFAGPSESDWGLLLISCLVLDGLTSFRVLMSSAGRPDFTQWSTMCSCARPLAEKDARTS